MRDEQLQAFVSAARAHVEADTRRRRRWLRRQLDEDQTFEEICRTMARSGVRVRVTVANGHRHSGRIVAAEPEVVAIASDAAVVYIATWALVALEPLTGSAGSDAPSAIAASTIDDVVLELGERHGAIVVGTHDGTVHRGRLAGVGRDLLWFDTGCHLRMAAITEVAAGR